MLDANAEDADSQLPLNPAMLLSFMEQQLKALEDAQGETDNEARAKLQELRGKTSQLGSPATAVQPMSDVELAQHLARMEEQLLAVEAQLACANDDTKQLLHAAMSQSASTPAQEAVDSQ